MEDVVSPWKGRRVFLTGHTGFKGGWLSLWLAGLGANVRGYALDPEEPNSLFSAAKVGEVLEDVRGDIRDASRMQSALTAFQPEVIFHLAAQPLVKQSYEDPVGTFATNVMGTAHLLEAIRKAPTARAVVCVTTDKVYENREWEWPYRESDPLGGFDPYSSSKACAELVVNAFRNSFFPTDRLSGHKVAIVTVRAGNVIGGGDWAKDRLIPDLVQGFQAKQPVRIRHPKAIRPWQHVLDPLHGYIQLAERMLTNPERLSHAFNFGPSDEDTWPVERIAKRLADLWGAGASWICDEADHVHEHRSLRLSASRAHAELGWQPRLKIESALEWTLKWHQRWLSGADMKVESEAQIRAYESLG